MSDVEDKVVREVRRLLREGRSLAITTLDEPGSIDLTGMSDDVVEDYAAVTRGRRCVQRVTLPDGTVICIKYED